MCRKLTVSVAIEKGEFDDDDAEAVKGLGRIGGGRLHAKSITVALAQNGQASFYPGGQSQKYLTSPQSIFCISSSSTNCTVGEQL